jgi:tRNA(Ile)-lysidine synthase
LAQHADDQVETVLLALARGAGLAGLAAMPARWERDGLHWCRPLLAVPAAGIRQWLVARGLEQGRDWVEDPTNADSRYTRNRIRLQVMPALEAAFPHLRQTFARSASHAAQAQRLLNALAAEDLARVQPDGYAGPQVKLLQALPRDRQANVLRYWVRKQCSFAPSAAQLEELLDQVKACTTRGHRIRIKVASGFVLRAGPVIGFHPG